MYSPVQLTHATFCTDDTGEAAEITDKQLGDFFDHMDECAKGSETELVRVLRSVNYPADMSQLLVCVNMAGQDKRDCIAKSKACMAIFVSWMQVQYSLLSARFQLRCFEMPKSCGTNERGRHSVSDTGCV